MAGAGIVGPVLFTAGFLVPDFFRRAEYDPDRRQVSDLTARHPVFGRNAAGTLLVTAHEDFSPADPLSLRLGHCGAGINP